MVEIKKIDYNLNHIYNIDEDSPVIPIGFNLIEAQYDIVLFNRSLALASDLKKLPVCRGIHGQVLIAGTFRIAMAASLISTVQCVVQLYNTSQNKQVDDNRIFEVQGMVDVGTSAAVFDMPVNNEILQGGLLLNSTISINVLVMSNVNVASADLIKGLMSTNLKLEIDWVSVKKDEFEDFILESVYAEELD